MSWSYKFKKPLPAPYQFEALRRALKRKRFGVLFQQRVGKTRVSVDFCGVRNAREGKRKFLIICPKSVVTYWPEAIIQYWNGPPCLVCLVHVPEEDDGRPTFVVVNYDQFRIHAKEYSDWKPDVLILDEVQYCQTHTSKRSRAIQKLSKMTPDVIGMTGTPGKPENGWFGIMAAIDESVFGPYFNHYEREYLNSTRARGYFELLGRGPEDWYRNRNKLEAKFAEATMRVLREDAGIVDEFEDINIPVELEPKVKALYKQLDKDSYLALPTGEITAGIVLTRDLRLHQLAGGFLKYDDGRVEQVSKAKLTKCLELVKDLRAEDKQVIIVCKFSDEIAALKAAISEAVVIQGSTSDSVRQEYRHGFQAGKYKVLIGQEKAISTGIDLTAAHNMIFYSVDFSLLDYQQVRDRVLGRAQKNPVTYWHLVAKGTVDKDVYTALQRGENVVKALVDARRWKR